MYCSTTDFVLTKSALHPRNAINKLYLMMKSTFTQLFHSRYRSWLILLLCLSWSIVGYGQKTIALFYDSNCSAVSMAPGEEGYTILTDLQNLGHTVNTFSGSTGAEWAAGLTGAELVVIPETESCQLSIYLDADAQNELEAFVDGGGGMIISHQSTNDASLNAIFGFMVSDASASDPITYNAGNASGTLFDGTAATLAVLSATSAFSGLPTGSEAIYEDNNGNAAVALIPYGTGGIVWLGWDWYQGSGTVPEFDAWRSVLEQAVLQVAQCVIPDAVFTIEQSYGPTCFNGNDGAIFLG